MTGNYEVQHEHTRWATHVLDIDSTCSSNELTKLALARLCTDDFVLWQQADLAVRVLAGSDESNWTPGDLATLRQLSELALWDEVEKFCKSFFEMSAEQRNTRHKSIVSRGAKFPAIAMRMKQLVPGLKLAPWSEQKEIEDQGDGKTPHVILDDEMKESLTLFGDDVIRFFLSPPSGRGSLERTLVKKWDEDPLWWSKVASQFDLQYPEYSRLAPDLVNRVRYLPAPSHHWRTRTDRHGHYRNDGQQRENASESSAWMAVFIIPFLITLFNSSVFRFEREPDDGFHSNYNLSPFTDKELHQRIDDEIKKYRLTQKLEEPEKTSQSNARFEEFVPFSFESDEGDRFYVLSMDRVAALVESQPELMQSVLTLLEKRKYPTGFVEIGPPAVRPMEIDNPNLKLLNGLPEHDRKLNFYSQPEF